MRFLIFGAGAIGTYIGGSLSLKGFPIVFLETPEAASLISEKVCTSSFKMESKRYPHRWCLGLSPNASHMDPMIL